MLTRPQVQRYAAESGLRVIMIAEKEIVLTFLLQLLSERGLLDRLDDGFGFGTHRIPARNCAGPYGRRVRRRKP